MACVVAFLGGAAVISWRSTQPEKAAFDTLSALVARADVIAAVSDANAAPAQDMGAHDLQWRKEMANGGTGPLTNALMGTALSRQLALDRISSDGQVQQIMVMDRRGALVAADRPTHDFDQSDEPKWIRTIGNNTREPVFEGHDKSSGGTVDQLTQAIADPDGKIIGAVTLRWCGGDDRCRHAATQLP